MRVLVTSKELQNTGHISDTSPDIDSRIRRGQRMVVYGIVFRHGQPEIFLGDFCPYLFPIKWFDVIDDRMSKYWYIGQWETSELVNDESKLVNSVILGYREFVRMPKHFSGIVDGNKADLDILRCYRILLDREFPFEEAQEAIPIEQGWSQCPKCFDAWQPTPISGMIVCPTCQLDLRNPFYVDHVSCCMQV